MLWVLLSYGKDGYAAVPTSFVGAYLHILQEGIIYKLGNFMVLPRTNILNLAAAPFLITCGFRCMNNFQNEHKGQLRSENYLLQMMVLKIYVPIE